MAGIYAPQQLATQSHQMRARSCRTAEFHGGHGNAKSGTVKSKFDMPTNRGAGRTSCRFGGRNELNSFDSPPATPAVPTTSVDN